MNTYVFRNHTIEFLFSGNNYEFSGYDEFYNIPEKADRFIWFYQLPILFSNAMAETLIKEYMSRLEYIVNNVSEEKEFLIFTLANLYFVKDSISNHHIEQLISNFNEFTYELECKYTNIRAIDFGTFINGTDTSNIIDWKYYFISHMLIGPHFAPRFKQWWDAIEGALSYKRKKCLVVDLDNTLWGGILGEDGIDGILLGEDYPGNAYLCFQKALLNLNKNGGVILAAISKNNESDVLELWEKNPFVILKRDFFSAYRINWNNKADNMLEIAEELNIGLDSMVFVDDNPAERELIREKLPEVNVPEFPTQPYLLPVFYKELVDKYFTASILTKEDRNKVEQYKQNAERKKEKLKFSDYDSYIKSLKIEISINEMNEFNIARIAQMTQKTNQFNVTTHRYNEFDLKKMKSEGVAVWCISVKDKFGDYGITGAIIFNQNCNLIDDFLLSCRILGKGIEFAFLKSMLQLFYESGRNKIFATYIPTRKNQQVRDFFEKMGFELMEELEDGRKEYCIILQEEKLNDDKYVITIGG